MSLHPRLAVLFLVLPAAWSACARGPALLKGRQGVYDIPADYLKSPAAGHGDPSKSDKATMLSLKVPLTETTLRSEEPADELNLQVFADKRYELVDTFTLPAKRCLEGAPLQERQAPFFVYRKSARGSASACYFTFDPEAVPLALKAADYYVRTSKGKSFQIAGTAIAPRGSCTLSFIRDGILIDAWALGGVCTPENFAQIRLSVDTLFDRWRKK